MCPGVSTHPFYPLPLLGSQSLGNFPNPSLIQWRPPPTWKRRSRKHPIRGFGRKVSAISIVIQVVLMGFFSLFKVSSIQSFHHWLTGPDNDKGHCTGTQHAKQLLLIWRKVSPTLTIEDLFNMEEVKEKWLRPFLQSFRPGTVKSSAFPRVHNMQGTNRQRGGCRRPLWQSIDTWVRVFVGDVCADRLRWRRNLCVSFLISVMFYFCLLFFNCRLPHTYYFSYRIIDHARPNTFSAQVTEGKSNWKPLAGSSSFSF